MLSCPQCGKHAASVQGLAKHLSGTNAYGGHDMTADEARVLAGQVASSVRASPSAKRLAVPSTARAPVAARNLESTTERSFLTALMTSMAGHKALPKYQLERRVDAFLAVLLPDLLGQLLDTEVEFVVPEFPLKAESSSQSTNVDHVYFDRRGRWIFVEIKTDTRSVKQAQIDCYLRAAGRGMAPLLADVPVIRRASKQPRKYTALLDRLADFPADGPVDVLYLAPAKSVVPNSAGMRVVSYTELAAFEHRVFPEEWGLFRSLLIAAIE